MVKKGSLFFILIILSLFTIPVTLHADRAEDFDLQGPVQEVRNFRASYYFRFGKWQMSPFFPFSDLINRTADRLFDKEGYCLRTYYLQPDGESRYTAASSHKDNGRMEKVCYDYLSDEGERFLLKYDEQGRILEQRWIRTGDVLYDTRYFIYDGNLVREEAYGTTGHLYERVFYQYDAAGRCIEKLVKGYPYDMQIRRESSQYDEKGNLTEKSIYRFDDKLVEKTYFFYDEGNRLKEKIIQSVSGRKVERRVFRYEWKVDGQGNWTERIEVEILKKHDRWIEEPRLYYRRVITYY